MADDTDSSKVKLLLIIYTTSKCLEPDRLASIWFATSLRVWGLAYAGVDDVPTSDSSWPINGASGKRERTVVQETIIIAPSLEALVNM